MAAFSNSGITYSATATAATSSRDDPASADFTYRFDSDGGIRYTTETEVGGTVTTDQTPWSSLHPGETSTFHMRISYVSGDTVYSFGESLATWVASVTDRTWSFTNGAGPGTLVGVYKVDLSDDGGTTTLDTNNITITLTVDP